MFLFLDLKMTILIRGLVLSGISIAALDGVATPPAMHHPNIQIGDLCIEMVDQISRQEPEYSGTYEVFQNNGSRHDQMVFPQIGEVSVVQRYVASGSCKEKDFGVLEYGSQEYEVSNCFSNEQRKLSLYYSIKLSPYDENNLFRRRFLAGVSYCPVSRQHQGGGRWHSIRYTNIDG